MRSMIAQKSVSDLCVYNTLLIGTAIESRVARIKARVAELTSNMKQEDKWPLVEINTMLPQASQQSESGHIKVQV